MKSKQRSYMTTRTQSVVSKPIRFSSDRRRARRESDDNRLLSLDRKNMRESSDAWTRPPGKAALVSGFIAAIPVVAHQQRRHPSAERAAGGVSPSSDLAARARCPASVHADRYTAQAKGS